MILILSTEKTAKSILQFNMIIAGNRTNCYWCGQGLRECGMCKGSGLFKGSDCKPCNAQGRLCPTHEGDWER